MSTKDYISPSNVSSKPIYSSPIIIRNPKNVMLLCYMKFDINVEGYFEFYRRFRKQVVRNLKENETVSPTFEDVILMWCLERIDSKLPGLIYKKIGIKIFQAPQLCSLTDRIFELIPKLLEKNQILNPTTDPLQAVFLPKCQTPEIKEELDEIKLDLEEVIPEQLDVKPSIEIGNSWSFSPILQNPGQVSQLENNSPLWKIRLPGGISSNDYEKPKIRVLPPQNVPNQVRIAKPIIIGPNGTPKFIRIAPKDYVPPKISQNSNAVPSKFPSIENSIQVGANPSKIVYFDKKKQKLTEGVMVNNKIVSTDDLINIAVNQNKEPIPNVPNVMLKKIILKPKEIERLRECEQLESVDPIELKFNESKDEINMASYGCEEAISVASNENEDTMNLTSNEDDEQMSIAPALNQEQNTEYLQVIRITPNQYIMLSNIFPDKFQYKERRSKEDGKMSVTLSLTELKLLKGLIKLFPGKYKNLNSIIVPSARASNENLNPGEIRKLKDIMGILKDGKEVSAKIKKRKLLSTNQKDEKKKKTNNASASNKEEIKRKSKKNNFQLLCPLCRKQITFGLLEGHIRDIHMRTEAVNMTGIWKCSWCQEECVSKYELQTHISLRHSGVEADADLPKGLSCPECQQNYFYSHTSLRVHRFYNHSMEDGVMRYFCFRCDTKYESSEALVQHMKEVRHEDDKEVTTKYYCTICNTPEGFLPSIGALNFHLRSAHRQDRQENEIQAAAAAAPVLKLMNESKCKHCCEFCGKKYEKNHALQEHIDKLHAAGDQEKSEKSCLCPDCGKVLKFKNRLNHLKLCQNKEKKQKITTPYSCGVCMKTFQKLLYLKRHKLTHEGEKFHECDLCEALFEKPKFLTCHKREFHTRAGLDRSMECDICHKVFKNKNTLRKHKRYYHWGELKGDKKCSICGEEKANKYVLERHMETHKNPLEREKFECLGGCGKLFLTPLSMMSHYNEKKCKNSE